LSATHPFSTLSQLKAKSEEQRKHTREAIETFFTSLGQSLTSFITDKSKVTTTVVGLTALAAGVYGMREGSRVAGRFIEKRLGTPSLVRETSKSSGAFSFAASIKRLIGAQKVSLRSVSCGCFGGTHVNECVAGAWVW
jgi:Domain of unknown function (DUF3523)